MSGMFRPKIETTTAPAAAPPAPTMEAPRLKIAGASEQLNNRRAARTGRSALRIDLNAGNATADGTGINIPRA